MSELQKFANIQSNNSAIIILMVIKWLGENLKKQLLIISLIFSSFCVFAEGNYTNNSKINCKNTNVSVASYCHLNGDDYPMCKKQELLFKNGRISKKIIYKPENYESYQQPLISRVSCIKNSNSYYILIENTNYANCKNCCEWIDLYTAKGRYLGSTKGISNALTLKTKKIPYKYTNAIENSSVLSESFVSRTLEK